MDFLAGCDMTEITDGHIKVLETGWTKFAIITSEHGPTMMECILDEDVDYKIEDVLVMCGINSESKPIVFDNVTYGGVDFVVMFCEHIENVKEEVVENEELPESEVLDIEQIYDPRIHDRVGTNGVILIKDGLQFDLKDYGSLAIKEWLFDSTVEFFINFFFY